MISFSNKEGDKIKNKQFTRNLLIYCDNLKALDGLEEVRS